MVTLSVIEVKGFQMVSVGAKVLRAVGGIVFWVVLLSWNKVAVVTGATGTLGSVVAKMLLERGVRVVASYRTDAKLGDLLEAVGDLWSNVTPVETDVTNEESVKNLIAKAVDKHGRIDLLFNIVGAYEGGSDVAGTEDSKWDSMMNVNLRSVFLCSKAVLPVMVQQNYGRIVNVSSWMAVERSRRGRSGAYAVSKAGVMVLTEVIAEEVKKYDINVNCVMPSTIDTPANRRDFPKADFSRWVAPKDIAEVMLFLVSDASKVVSGAAIPVYGKV